MSSVNSLLPGDSLTTYPGCALVIVHGSQIYNKLEKKNRGKNVPFGEKIRVDKSKAGDKADAIV